jgi:hypothetical protein
MFARSVLALPEIDKTIGSGAETTWRTKRKATL